MQRAVKAVKRHKAAAGAIAAVLVITVALLVSVIAERRAAVRRQVDMGIASAREAIEGVPTAARLAEQRAGSYRAGAYQERREERVAREAAIEACATAIGHVERALLADRLDGTALDLRRELGERLGDLARLGGDFGYARQAYRDLERTGVPPGRLEALLARIDADRASILKRRLSRLNAIIMDVQGGLSRPGRTPVEPTLEELVAEASTFREPAAVTALRAVFTPSLRERARSATRHTVWPLGRIGSDVPSAVDALAYWTDALSRDMDDDLVAETLMALCNTRQAAAAEVVYRNINRMKLFSGPLRERIKPWLARLPKAALRTAAAHTGSNLWERAKHLVESGQRDAGLALLDQGISAAPDDPATWSLYRYRGLVRMDAGQPGAALLDLRRAIELAGGGNALLESTLGNCLSRLGRLDEALASQDRALQLAPHEPSIINNRAHVLKKLGRLDEAIAGLRRVIEILSRQTVKRVDYPDYWMQLGLWLEEKGDLTGADAALSDGIARGHRVVRLFARRARVRLAQGRAEAAEADIRQALALPALCYGDYEGRAYVLRRRGDLAGALASLDRLLEIAPDAPDVLVDKGTLLEAMGRLDEAIAVHDHNLSRRPDHYNALINRGNARRRKGDVDGALADYERAIGAHPKVPAAYVLRGNVRAQRKDARGALADYDRAVELGSKLGSTYFNRALLHREHGRHAQAADDLREAVRREPGQWRNHALLGLELAAIGKRAEAIECLRRALPMIRDAKNRQFVERKLEALTRR